MYFLNLRRAWSPVQCAYFKLCKFFIVIYKYAGQKQQLCVFFSEFTYICDYIKKFEICLKLDYWNKKMRCTKDICVNRSEILECLNEKVIFLDSKNQNFCWTKTFQFHFSEDTPDYTFMCASQQQEYEETTLNQISIILQERSHR